MIVQYFAEAWTIECCSSQWAYLITIGLRSCNECEWIVPGTMED